MFTFWSTLEDLIVALTLSWIVWVIFSAIPRYLSEKAQLHLHEKLLQQVNSVESLAIFMENTPGRYRRSTDTLRNLHVEAPYGRILSSIQVGVILVFFGIALGCLHYRISDFNSGFLICGVGAIGLGLGFLGAAAASIVVSRRLGLIAPTGRS